MRPIATDAAWSEWACLSVSVLVTTVSPAKTAELIEVPFELWVWAQGTIYSGCLQLLEILEMKFLLEILEISWNFVDAPGKIYNQQCNFCTLRRPVIVS